MAGYHSAELSSSFAISLTLTSTSDLLLLLFKITNVANVQKLKSACLSLSSIHF